MKIRTILRFSLLGGLKLVAVCAIGLRLVAPGMEFQRFIDGDKTVRIREIEFSGQARHVVCRDPVLLRYFENQIRTSARQGRVYYSSGKPEGMARKYVPCSMQLALGSGAYRIDCSIASNELCMYFPFEHDASGECAPNRRIVFDGDTPEEILIVWEHLLRN